MRIVRRVELEYRGGRAASARKTRATVGTKTTLGEGVSAVGGTHDGPIMPHRMYGEEKLLRRYPPLESAAEAEEDEQLADALLMNDIEIAEQTVMDTVTFGRRRVQKTSGERSLTEHEDAPPPG